MKERLAKLNHEYYKATAMKDWIKAKKLLKEITDIQAELLKTHYTNIGCFK